MSKKQRRIGLALAAFLAAALWLGLLHVEGASPKTVYFLGKRNAAILAGATRVEAVSVGERSLVDAVIGGYAVRGKSVRLSQDLTAQASRLVLEHFDHRPYLQFMMKGCDPIPGMALRFYRGERRVDLLLCFACNQWQLVDENGQRAQWEDFDEQRPQFVRLAKSALLHDATIQKLAEKVR